MLQNSEEFDLPHPHCRWQLTYAQKWEVQDGFLGSEKEQYFVRHAVERGRFMASKLTAALSPSSTAPRLPTGAPPINSA
jgi:hypothetical protein